MRVYGHCGAQAYVQENTLEAFELAFKMGSYGIENDVRMSADGEIVVIHDPDTECRSGTKLVIADSTVAQLKELNLIDKTGKYPSLKIPMLSEVFDLMKKYPNMHINIELKDTGAKFLETVLATTARHKMGHRTFYSTGHVENLEWLQKNHPDIPTAYIHVEPDYTPAIKYGCVADHPHFRALTPEYVKAVHDAGLEINAWTVDQPEHIQNMIDLGIEGFMCNCPDVALEILNNK